MANMPAPEDAKFTEKMALNKYKTILRIELNNGICYSRHHLMVPGNFSPGLQVPLRFALTMDDELRILQFRALPFGLTSAPRVFTKVILPVGHSAHMRAVCLLQYHDDWLLRSPDELRLSRQTSWLLDAIRQVGFILNLPKSQLVSTQRLTHIGVEYQLDIGLMFPPMERVRKVEGRIRALLTVRVTTAYFWLSLLGLLSSATYAIPLGRLYIRPLQHYLLAHWAPV